MNISQLSDEELNRLVNAKRKEYHALTGLSSTYIGRAGHNIDQVKAHVYADLAVLEQEMINRFGNWRGAS